MIFLLLIMNLFVADAETKPLIFKAYTDKTVTVDVTKHKNSILFVDENCPKCTTLINKIHKKCSSFKKDSFSVFATGKKKNLKEKIDLFIKKEVPVFTHTNIQDLLSLGLIAVPSYMNKKREIFTGGKASFKAFKKEKVCVK